MSSPFIDLLIRRYVIPDLYPSSPLNKVPLRGDYKLDTVSILEAALSYFDKDIIQIGRSRLHRDGLTARLKREFHEKALTKMSYIGSL
jgi:hypothetical protein